MAKLINGNGNVAIYAEQDADLIASICGNKTAISAVGNQFNYTQQDANTISVADGVIITKEGRRIQLDTGLTDLFNIPTGVLGATSYYIIGYHLIQNLDSSQICETFVQKMDNASDIISEDTFKDGANEIYVSLYRITQNGLNISSVDLLLPKMFDIAKITVDLDKLYLTNTAVMHPETIPCSVGSSYTAPNDGIYFIGGLYDGVGSAQWFLDSSRTMMLYNNGTNSQLRMPFFLRKGTKIYTRNDFGTSYSVFGYIEL